MAERPSEIKFKWKTVDEVAEEFGFPRERLIFLYSKRHALTSIKGTFYVDPDRTLDVIEDYADEVKDPVYADYLRNYVESHRPDPILHPNAHGEVLGELGMLTDTQEPAATADTLSQTEIDALLEAAKPKSPAYADSGEITDELSQEEIDALFNAKQEADVPAKKPGDLSQAEVDALLAKKTGSTVVYSDSGVEVKAGKGPDKTDKISQNEADDIVAATMAALDSLKWKKRLRKKVHGKRQTGLQEKIQLDLAMNVLLHQQQDK